MFCNQCGAQIPPGAQFCGACGHPIACDNPIVIPAPTPTDTQPDLFTLTVIRENQWFLVNPSIHILVDDVQNYDIANASTIQISLSKGTHVLYFSCGFRSKKMQVPMAGNQCLHVNWDRLTGEMNVW